MSKEKEAQLNIYEITNRTTGSKRYVADTTAVNACEQLGWLIDDCFVMEQEPRTKWNATRGTYKMAKIPCRVCPFQYAECTKEPNLVCPTRPSSPELQNWLKQAAEARLCPYVGDSLAKRDHEKGQKWLPVAEAIKELSSQ